MSHYLLTPTGRCGKVRHMSDEITTREALDIIGWKSPVSITRLVAEGKLVPARKLPGIRGAFLFLRADIERIAAERAAGVA